MIRTHLKMSVLYQRSHPGKLIITINEISKGNAEIVFNSLMSQHVCVYDLRASAYYIYNLTGNGGTIEIKDPYPWYDGDYSTFTSYIWNISGGDSSAKIYGKIFPFRPDFVNSTPVVKTITSQGLISIHVRPTASSTSMPSAWMGVYNSNNTSKFIIGKKFTHELKPKTSKKFKCSVPLDELTIRDSLKPQNMAYNDLSQQERETYIPMEVVKGQATQISIYTKYTDWVPADDHMYHGTLSYVSTFDKELHMMDVHGNEYRYGVDQFRYFIPMLVQGKVSGSFKYTVRSGNRTIKYVLVPVQTSDCLDLELCDSDSDDGERPDLVNPNFMLDEQLYDSLMDKFYAAKGIKPPAGVEVEQAEAEVEVEVDPAED
jgi:hypothetical protein